MEQHNIIILHTKLMMQYVFMAHLLECSICIPKHYLYYCINFLVFRISLRYYLLIFCLFSPCKAIKVCYFLIKFNRNFSFIIQCRIPLMSGLDPLLWLKITMPTNLFLTHWMMILNFCFASHYYGLVSCLVLYHAYGLC